MNNHNARKLCVQFLYQCEIDKINFYNDSKISSFLKIWSNNEKIQGVVKEYAKGVMGSSKEIDKKISMNLSNWSLDRIAILDKIIIRLAVFELINQKEPEKVVLNEAIELAKLFGTNDSKKFVNGVLDKILNDLSHAK